MAVAVYEELLLHAATDTPIFVLHLALHWYFCTSVLQGRPVAPELEALPEASEEEVGAWLVVGGDGC